MVIDLRVYMDKQEIKAKKLWAIEIEEANKVAWRKSQLWNKARRIIEYQS